MDRELSLLKEIGKLQLDYKKVLRQGRVTKKDICDLIRPFKDKYGLTDLTALRIARNEMSITNMVKVFEKEKPHE